MMKKKMMMVVGENKRALMAVVLIQTLNAGMFLLSKAALDAGMNHYVFIFYRQAAATIFLSPFLFFFQWKDAPPLTFSIFCKIFMLSLFGIVMFLNLYAIALVYTSATMAAAIANCLPVITFFAALLFRVEVLRFKSIAGTAKLAGMLFCIGGVAMLALYKGPQLNLFNKHHLFSIHNPNHHSSNALPKSWLKGCLLMLASITIWAIWIVLQDCFLILASNTLWGIWIVLQALVLKIYPSTFLMTNLQCILSTFQSFAIVIAMERHTREWKLGWNIRLLSVAYCGVMTAVTYYLRAWVIEKKGPVYIAMSTPLTLIITIFFSAIFIGESITLGSTLGGMLLVGGLYFVLWGKSKEQKISEELLLKEGSKECNNMQGKDITKLGNDENAASSSVENV